MWFFTIAPRVRHTLFIVMGVVLLIAGFGVTTLIEQHAAAVERARAEDVPLVYSIPSKADVAAFGPRPELSHASFFAETKQKFLDDKASFIEADLSAMRITIWKNGVETFSAPIQTKGRPGSWWQTPAGVYKVEAKRESHFSSFGHVYTDWNLPFQGNFFIHGWPYYPDGTPVPQGYSGGCIRLNNDDAKALYEQAEVGMPVLVFEQGFEPDGFSYTPPTPTLDARGYAVVDLRSGEALSMSAATTTAPIASITKLMTALVATEYLNLDKRLTVPQSAVVPTSVPRLTAGQEVLAFHLLYPMLLESSNEAALTIADALDSDRFVALMNAKASAIGMHDSTFADAAGIAAGNESTVQDLARLAQYVYLNRPFLFAMTAGTLDSGAYASQPFPNVQNFNYFGGDPSFIGGKVGETTAAGETMVAVFEEPVRGTKRPIVYVVLGAKNVKADVETLRAWVGKYYK